MSTPSITPAMVTVAVGQVIAVAVAFGASLTGDQQKAILALSVTVGAVLLWADVKIRKHRAENLAAITAAKAAATPPRPRRPRARSRPPVPPTTAPPA